MICDNCGMDHKKGQNKLCNGPFLHAYKFEKLSSSMSSRVYLIRNQFNHRMKTLGQELTDEDKEVIKKMTDFDTSVF